MPRVLQINVSSNRGSTGRIAEQIGLLANQNGWDTYMIYGRSMNPSSLKTIKVGTMLNVYEHYLEHRVFDNDGLASRGITKLLVKQIQTIRPDLIHLHNIHGHWLNIRILFDYLASLSIPIVWTQHDCWAFTGGCYYFDMLGCEKWKTGCSECSLREQGVLPFFDRSCFLYNLRKELFNKIECLTLVPVSNWLENLERESFLSKHRILTIHNGVDINAFKPSDGAAVRKNYKITDNTTIVLGVASVWEPRKGLDDFIRLSSLVDDNTIIVLVGVSSKQIQSLPCNIIGIERTDSLEELRDIYSAADLYANLTYEDNFPTTNLEALACGTPVLTYQTGGSVEAVNKETGFIVRQGDLNAVLEIINLVRESNKSSFSEACRERAVSFFNKDDRFIDYINLYNALLDEGR